jgi:hypothetical protein
MVVRCEKLDIMLLISYFEFAETVIDMHHTSSVSQVLAGGLVFAEERTVLHVRMRGVRPSNFGSPYGLSNPPANPQPKTSNIMKIR